MERNSLRRIVAASDLSEESDAALRTAAALAVDRQVEVRAYHCVRRPSLPHWKEDDGAERRDAWLADARTRLEQQVLRVGGDVGAVAGIAVGFGSPAVEIGRFARETAADLIVLGPHEPRMVLDDLLGSTADRVIRISERPCLLAHRPVTRPLRHVLLATDFSKHARHALEVVADWLAQGAAPAVLELLHVYAYSSSFYRPFRAEPLLEKEIAAVRERLGDDVVDLHFRTVSAARAVEGLAEAADAAEADLIALGTHGGGFVERMLTGGTANAAARMVRHPLLLVPLRD